MPVWAIFVLKNAPVLVWNNKSYLSTSLHFILLHTPRSPHLLLSVFFHIPFPSFFFWKHSSPSAFFFSHQHLLAFRLAEYGGGSRNMRLFGSLEDSNFWELILEFSERHLSTYSLPHVPILSVMSPMISVCILYFFDKPWHWIQVLWFGGKYPYLSAQPSYWPYTCLYDSCMCVCLYDISWALVPKNCLSLLPLYPKCLTQLMVHLDFSTTIN